MKRPTYIVSKVKSAWSSGTLWQTTSRFLATRSRQPTEVLWGYLRLPAVDRRLNVKDGYQDHRTEEHHHRSNSEHLRRIVAAYKKSKQAEGQAASPFVVRGLWAEWISVNFGTLIAALEAEDLPELSSLFENLFREQCTNGMGGYDNYVLYRAPLGSLYIKYVWSKYRDKLLTLDFDPARISFPDVGNQTGVVLNGKVISIETLRHVYHAVEICELLRDVPRAVCVEIGSGLGGQAYQTVHLGGEGISKYVAFDIPEVAALISYFLLAAFPDKRVRLFGEGPVSVSAGEEYDVAVFPHFTVEQLPDSSVDLFYNSCSFSEMDGASSGQYLSVIERCCRKYFLHDNHDTVLEFKAPDGSISVNHTGSQLIPAPASFKRVFKKPRVHGLPEDRSFVHFEYLYERM